MISYYNNLINTYRLPRIDDIPDLELYMDQVIIYVKKYFSIFPYGDEPNFITPAMINNYVKSGMMPSPTGKKYTKRHIAYIFVIFYLKQILSLEEVKSFILLQIKQSSEKEAYEAFCNILEDELKKCTLSKTENQQTDISANESSLRHVAVSIAHKLYTQNIIKNQLTRK